MAKFPGPVVFQDDDPKKGFVALTLTLPGLMTKMFNKTDPKNGQVDPKFESSKVTVTIKVTDKSGVTEEFLYERSLPEDIDAEASYHNVKEGKVILFLRKASSGSWTEHSKHFIRAN